MRAITWAGTHYVLSNGAVRRMSADGGEVLTVGSLPTDGVVDADNSGRILVLALEAGVVTYSQDDLRREPERRRAIRR